MRAPYDGRHVVRRAAVLAYHSSPLAEPGSGDAGGMTVYVRALAESLARMGVCTDIFTRAAADVPRITALNDGVRVVAIDAGPARPLPKEEVGRYVEDFATGVRAFAAMQRIDYDIVHSHYWQSGVAGVAAARFWGAPLVHSQHTLARVKNSNLAPGDSPEPQDRIDGEDLLIGSADVLIASTDEEWSELACLYGAEHDRIVTIHPGVDHALFNPGDGAATRAQLGISPADAVMLYVGRIEPLKGLELAVRAAEKLVPALDRRLVFLVVGGASGTRGEEELGRIRELADSLGLSDVVRFVGPQPHNALPGFYRAADAVVVCSHSESFGLAALEAHACGTPVVATAVGGLAHVVRDGRSGWLVDTRDPAAFADRLEGLLRDPIRTAAFSKEAHRRSRRFSWELTAEGLLELYDCLVNERLPEACTC